MPRSNLPITPSIGAIRRRLLAALQVAALAGAAAEAMGAVAWEANGAGQRGGAETLSDLGDVGPGDAGGDGVVAELLLGEGAVLIA